MEKQRIDRIMEMIQNNEALKKQYEENKEATISIIHAWLDAEDQGKELDPYYSQREALTYDIQKLEHDLIAYQEKGLIAEASLIVDELVIKKQRLALIGAESEYPEEVAELRAMEMNIEESKAGLQEYKAQGPRL